MLGDALKAARPAIAAAREEGGERGAAEVVRRTLARTIETVFDEALREYAEDLPEPHPPAH